MAGFPGNPKRLGSAGIPPPGVIPTVTATTNFGTDTFYEMGFVLAEDINPNASANPRVSITATPSNATDTYYAISLVLAESTTHDPTAGTFRITATGSVGTDTYYALAIVLSE